MKTKCFAANSIALFFACHIAWAAPFENKTASSLRATDLAAAKTWSQNFPKLAARVRYFDERITSPNEKVRLKLIKELTYFDARNTKDYLPFFKALLQDASPAVRWEAAHRLWEHNRFLHARELPESFHVPLVGLLDLEQSKTIEHFRAIAQTSDAPAGWAIHALAIISDKASIPAARKLLGSSNIFTRFSAAMALVQLGEKQQGINALIAIAEGGDGYAYYQSRAAETLYRFGDKTKLGVLVNSIDDSPLVADQNIAILEDLTGEYFASADEWQQWWSEKSQGKNMIFE